MIQTRALSHGRPRRYSAQLLCGVSLSALVLFGFPLTGHSADFYWDVNGTAVGSGGTGTWNPVNLYWSPSGDGVSGPYRPWSNITLDNAIFGGTAGTVTLGGPITAQNITFNTAGYMLSGNTLTLTGTNPTINTAGAVSISSIIAGSTGLTKSGNDILTLTGLNVFTGGINLNAGSLFVTDDRSLGALGNNISTAPGAFVRLSIANGTTSRTVTIGDGGTLSVEGAAGGSALITGNGNVTVGINATMRNDANTYTGMTRFNGCDGVCSFYFTSIADLGQASSLGAPTTASAGTIIFNQVAKYSDSVIYVGTGHSSNRKWILNGDGAVVRNQGTGTLTLVGDISNAISSGFNAENADIELLGVISGNNANLNFGGNIGHSIVLGGANTYGGTTAITTLVKPSTLANTGVSSSFGTGSIVNIDNNAIVSYTGASTSTNREWNADGVTAILNDGTGDATLTGALNFASGGTAIDSVSLGGSYSGENRFTGVISGTGNIISVGSTSWTLSGANTYTGSVTVNGGTLRAGSTSAFGAMTGLTVNDGTLDLNGNDLTAPSLNGSGGTVALGNNTLTIDTTVVQSYRGTITGNGGLTKLGAGTLTLTGSNSFNGPTTIGAGKLALDFSSMGGAQTDIISNASSLILSGGILELTGAANESNSQSFSSLNIVAGSNMVRAISGTSGSIDLNLGSISRSGGLVNFVLANNGTIATSSSDGHLGGWATVNSSDYATVASGKITAFAETDYTHKDDAASWQTGEIISDSAGASNTPFFGTLTSNIQLGGLRYSAASNSQVDIGNLNILGVDGTILVAPSVSFSNQTISGGALTGGVGGNVLGLQHNGAGAFTIASTIIDNGGATGFIKGGAGSAVLSGANTYTGATTLSGGSLWVNTIGYGGVASNIGASSANSANLVLEGGEFRYTGATAISDRGFTLVNGGDSRDINVTNTATNLTFSGQITSPDDAGFTKLGAGTLTLSNAANNYIGVTTISGGRLAITTLTNAGLASSIGAASSDPANIRMTGGTLAYTGPTTSTNRSATLGAGGGGVEVTDANVVLSLTAPLTGTGDLRKEGPGTLVLSGANSYAAGTTINSGTLRAGASNVLGAGQMTVKPGTLLDLANFNNSVNGLNGAGNIDLGTATLTVNNTGIFTGTITGSGGLTRAGAGSALTLNTCRNDYTGVTNINGTALSVDCLADGGQASSIGASGKASSNLVLNAGTLNYTGGSIAIDRGLSLISDNIIGVANAAASLEISGDIIGESGGLRKSGPGTLVLSGNNSSKRNAHISGGTLRAGSVNALGSGALTVDDITGALFDLDGFSNSVGYLTGGGSNGGNINLSTATLTINTGNTFVNANYAGIMSGSGSLIKNGGSYQRLSGCNSSYTGTTAVNGGVLSVNCLSDGGAISSIGMSSSAANSLLLNGGTLQYIGTGSSTDREFTLGSEMSSTLDASGTGALAFTSTAPITFNTANSAHILTLTGTNLDNNSLSASIVDNGSGVTALTKSGIGSWILTNPNSGYTGITTVSGGVLGVDKLADGGVASSIGASAAAAANLVIGNNSTFRYTGAGDTTNRLFTLSAGVTFIESMGTGAIIFTDTGPVTLQNNNNARTIALGGTNTDRNTLAGSIGNAGTGVTMLTKNDSGVWVLTGNHSYSGSTNINQGTLFIGGGSTTGSIASSIVNNSGMLIFDRSDSLTYAGTIDGIGALSQAGTGTTTLTGNHSYQGTTTVSAGTLRINGNQSLATGLTTVLAGATLGGSGIIGGGVTVANDGRIAPGNSPGMLTINGPLELNSGSILDIEYGERNVVGGPLNDLIVVNDNLILYGTINVTASAGGSFDAGLYRIINYTGTLSDNGLAIGAMPAGSINSVQTAIANQINLINTAGLTLNFWDGAAGPQFDGLVQGGDGVWQNISGNNFWTDVDGAVNGSYADNAIAIFSAAPGTVTIDDTLGAVSVSGLQFASHNYVITGNPLVLTGLQPTIRVGDGTMAGLDFTATIASELLGVSQLVKSDLGTLILTGANSYSGGTVIKDGTLQISSDSNLGISSGGLIFNDGRLHTTANITSARSVSLTSSGKVKTDSGTILSLNGLVDGAGALSKDGTGTLILSADNAYIGGTTIVQGMLQLGHGGITGSIMGDVLNNGTLAFNRSDNITFSDVISGTGSVSQSGSATLILSGKNTYMGGTTISAGTLQLGNGTTSGSLVGNVVNNGAFTFNRSDMLVFTGNISGSGTLNQTGYGTTILSGANSYQDVTTIANGTLLVNGMQAAATGATHVAAGAILGGIGVIGGDVTINNLGRLAPGSNGVGTLTINENLTLAAGSVLDYDFGQSNHVGGALNDLTIIGGNLVLDGQINIAVSPGGSFDAGLYRIFSYDGSLTDNGLSINTKPTGSTASVQTAVSNQINLLNTAGLVLNFWDGAAGPQFDGLIHGGDGLWHNSAGNNYWTDSSGTVNDTYTDGSFAIFSAAPGTVTVDNDLGIVTASGLQFASDGYIISGHSLTLTKPQSTIRVGDGTIDGADFTATIASELTGTGKLYKTDLGTLILTGNNSYTGGTEVTTGTLLIDGDQSSAPGTTHVGTATLGGSGIIGGDIILAGGTLAPGSNGVGTMTIMGNLSLDASTTLSMQFGQAGIEGGALNDLINVGGDLVLSGLIDVTVPTGGSFDAGIYRVLNYGGMLTDNGLNLGITPAASSVAVQTAVTGQVNLINAGGMFLNYWDGNNGLKFNGVVDGGDGVWQSGMGNNNWTDDTGTINAPYQDSGFAVFSAASGTVTIDNSLGQVMASGMQFASSNYTLTGDALELIGTQSTIRVGDSTQLGSDFTTTIASALTGTSQLIKTDLGILILSGNNSYSGGTAINGGMLSISGDMNLGDGAGSLSFNGGTLKTTADLTSDRALTFAGAGTFQTDRDTSFVFNGSLSGTGELTKKGMGRLLITGDNSGYMAESWVHEGVLAVNGQLGGTVDIAGMGSLEGNGRVGAVINAGIVEPGHDKDGTLTITGNYTSNGGELKIAARLNHDSSDTGLLLVNGSTFGNTQVSVVNRSGGFGAPTTEGIKIVDVAGHSDGNFALNGDYLFEQQQAVVVGAYGYRLYKGGINSPDGNWYLRSALLNPSEPSDPSDPSEPSIVVTPLYQPGVPLYESYAGSLQQLNKLGSLQQRTGNRVWGQRADRPLQGMVPKNITDNSGLWARIETAHARFKPDISTSNTTYDINTWKFQTGIDGLLLENEAGRFIGGVFVQYGTASSNVWSHFGVGTSDTTGYGLGATLTWYGENGFYVDAQAQLTQYDSNLNSITTGRQLVKGNDGMGYAVSVEAGQRITLDNNWSLTPQFQLAYSSVQFDKFADPYESDVSLLRSHSLISRFGIAANHNIEWRDRHDRLTRTHLYGVTNIYYDFADGSKVDVSGTAFESRNDRLYGGVNLGGSFNWANDKYSLYGEAQFNTSLNNIGDSNIIGGMIGFRMHW